MSCSEAYATDIISDMVTVKGYNIRLRQGSTITAAV